MNIIIKNNEIYIDKSTESNHPDYILYKRSDNVDAIKFYFEGSAPRRYSWSENNRLVIFNNATGIETGRVEI